MVNNKTTKIFNSITCIMSTPPQAPSPPTKLLNSHFSEVAQAISPSITTSPMLVLIKSYLVVDYLHISLVRRLADNSLRQQHHPRHKHRPLSLPQPKCHHLFPLSSKCRCWPNSSKPKHLRSNKLRHYSLICHRRTLTRTFNSSHQQPSNSLLNHKHSNHNYNSNSSNQMCPWAIRQLQTCSLMASSLQPKILTNIKSEVDQSCHTVAPNHQFFENSRRTQVYN